MISFNLMKNCWPLVDIPLCMDKGQRKRLDIGISVAIHMSVEISICYKIKVSYYIVKHCMMYDLELFSQRYNCNHINYMANIFHYKIFYNKILLYLLKCVGYDNLYL